MISNIKAFGKFLDQPLLISKLDKKMPYILGDLCAIYLTKKEYDSFKKTQNAPEEKKLEEKNKLINKAIILMASIASALLAPKIAGKLLNRAPIESVEKIKEKNRILIDEFLAKNNCDEKTAKILEKAKEKVLSLSEVKALFSKLDSDSAKELTEKLIPDPENIKAKDIFHEIGYLSVYGAIPVLGGIMGGIAADGIQKKDLSKTVPDKINEGIYQYLANIFMCNIGAGAALAILEKMNITSKAMRALGMTAGIIATGVLGGSKAANLINKKIISPILNPNKKEEEIKERKPEPLDLALHTDDIATVSLLSGLKWIEPALPVLYSVSGYRAGEGYRN